MIFCYNQCHIFSPTIFEVPMSKVSPTNKIPKEAGKSSFDLIDQQKLRDALSASKVDFILDFGCGVGNYLFALADRYPEAGKLVGIDLWGEGIDTLNRRARDLGISHVKGIKANGLNLDIISDAQVDLLLMATVLHDLAERNEDAAALKEVFRVLRPGGTLAVVEYKKVEARRGPPLNVRISETELPDMVIPFGFTGGTASDLGPCCYISTFTRAGR
jgi:ubiquinone/menaquinone biosynthesis C-methylase UbiE